MKLLIVLIYFSRTHIENCVSIDPDVDSDIFSLFAPWILTRISQGKGFDSVRGYVAEILAILLQSSQSNRIRLVELGGLDSILQILSYYRKRDPKNADEVKISVVLALTHSCILG